MTLKDFEKDINSNLLQKGMAYFDNDQVDNLEKIAEGSWAAEVHGTSRYIVVVATNRTQIRSWECDCPYDYGPICKHVIAVFYAIAAEMNSEAKTRSKGKSKPSKSKAAIIFKKVSKSDLEKFITDQFRWNRGLKNAFVTHFAELLDEDADTKYRAIVRNAYKSAQDRYGFVDYRSANQLFAPLSKLTQKAEELLGKHNLMESLAIVKAILEELPLMLHNMNDSSGAAGDIFYEAVNSFSQIIEQAPPPLKDNLFNYCLKEYPKSKYSDFSFEEIFLEELSRLVSNTDQEKSFFKMIDDRLKTLEQERYGDYQIVKLTKVKLAYFLANNRDEEAQKLITQNDQYPEFRKILVEQVMERRDWKSAKALCHEGIEIAEIINHYGIVINWYITLLEIAEKEGNISEQRILSEQLFFDHRFNMSYYKKLKSTYSKNEWADESERIINKLKGKKQSFGYDNPSTLAKIFIEENYQDRLMILLELNAKHIHFVDAFKDYLSDSYSEKLVDIYAIGILEQANSTGRKIYDEIAGYLRKLQRLKKGDTKVKSLIKQFREQYKMRPAMMDVLDKNFPETMIPPKGKNVQKMIDENLGLF